MTFADTTAHDDAEMARRLSPDPASIVAEDRAEAAEARRRRRADAIIDLERRGAETALALLSTAWLQARLACGLSATAIGAEDAAELRQLDAMARRLGGHVAEAALATAA